MLQMSVIIPTYNRRASVLSALQSLSQQTSPPDTYEVILVDDGSTEDVWRLVDEPFPFIAHCVRQANQGATIARNQGALCARGTVLVFMDSDITLSDEALAMLWEECTQGERIIAMGALETTWHEKSVFSQHMSTSAPSQNVRDSNGCVHFPMCNTQLLAIKRDDFFRLGMFRDPTEGRGWPNWDDVEFGYRAHIKGYCIKRNTKARGVHWHYALADLATYCAWWQRASRSVVWLFREYPEIQAHIPMYRDKAPIAWDSDPVCLVVRKATRGITTFPPVLWSLKRSTAVLERLLPNSALLCHAYRMAIGASITRGYREGLRERGGVESNGL